MDEKLRLAQRRDFYVYLHKDSRGRVFYVGKGTGLRAWSVAGRSREWSERAAPGYTVHVVAYGLHEWFAYEMEAELVLAFGRADLGRGGLVNKTDGGRGATTIVFNRPRQESVKGAAKSYEELMEEKRLFAIALETAQNPPKPKLRRKPRGAIRQRGIAVVCATTGEKFISIAEASRCTGAKIRNILRSIRGSELVDGFFWRIDETGSRKKEVPGRVDRGRGGEHGWRS